MRVIFARGEAVYGRDLVRAVGKCRACNRKNVVWIVKGMLITFARLGCEYCGSGDADKREAEKRTGKKLKKLVASSSGVEWRGLGCHGGKVVAKNYPERAKPGDIVV